MLGGGRYGWGGDQSGLEVIALVSTEACHGKDYTVRRRSLRGEKTK